MTFYRGMLFWQMNTDERENKVDNLDEMNERKKKELFIDNEVQGKELSKKLILVLKAIFIDDAKHLEIVKKYGYLNAVEVKSDIALVCQIFGVKTQSKLTEKLEEFYYAWVASGGELPAAPTPSPSNLSIAAKESDTPKTKKVLTQPTSGSSPLKKTAQPPSATALQQEAQPHSSDAAPEDRKIFPAEFIEWVFAKYEIKAGLSQEYLKALLVRGLSEHQIVLKKIIKKAYITPCIVRTQGMLHVQSTIGLMMKMNKDFLVWSKESEVASPLQEQETRQVKEEPVNKENNGEELLPKPTLRKVPTYLDIAPQKFPIAFIIWIVDRYHINDNSQKSFLTARFILGKTFKEMDADSMLLKGEAVAMKEKIHEIFAVGNADELEAKLVETYHEWSQARGAEEQAEEGKEGPSLIQSSEETQEEKDVVGAPVAQESLLRSDTSIQQFPQVFISAVIDAHKIIDAHHIQFLLGRFVHGKTYKEMDRENFLDKKDIVAARKKIYEAFEARSDKELEVKMMRKYQKWVRTPMSEEAPVCHIKERETPPEVTLPLADRKQAAEDTPVRAPSISREVPEHEPDPEADFEVWMLWLYEQVRAKKIRPKEVLEVLGERLLIGIEDLMYSTTANIETILGGLVKVFANTSA